MEDYKIVNNIATNNKIVTLLLDMEEAIAIRAMKKKQKIKQ